LDAQSEVLIENLVTYTVLFLLAIIIVIKYIKSKRQSSAITREKINKAKAAGIFEPVSLHPSIDPDSCIGSGACITACPEKDILGIAGGKATTINASRCVGHGACFHACPVQAISLVIGTEKRGVELPHVNEKFMTNVPGVYIAGELGGMGLIKNAVEQGKQAVENIASSLSKKSGAQYDLIIIGAGPAGIAASLSAKKLGISSVCLEQDSIGGTVFTFPRAKIVMTSPMDLPLYGKVKFVETNKQQILELWNEVITKNSIDIKEYNKVTSVQKSENIFQVETSAGVYTSEAILLAIGRRGSPRKLGVPGENLPKVYYRLLEPELIKEQDILVVGGGDSAVESAMMLADENNRVKLSYRADSFSRIKSKNLELLEEYKKSGKIDVILKSNVKEIKEKSALIEIDNEIAEINNDLVYVFAGGELPNQFLEKIGINITKKYGEVILKH